MNIHRPLPCPPPGQLPCYLSGYGSWGPEPLAYSVPCTMQITTVSSPLPRRFGEHFGQLLLMIDLTGAPVGTAADISVCSKFESEQEVLILPWLCFQISGIMAFDSDEQERWQAQQGVRLFYTGSRFDRPASLPLASTSGCGPTC